MIDYARKSSGADVMRANVEKLLASFASYHDFLKKKLRL